jgi:hypothetical protein
MTNILTDYDIDPELPDDLDTDSQHEVFLILRELGTTPEDLPYGPDATQYAAWLQKQRI